MSLILNNWPLVCNNNMIQLYVLYINALHSTEMEIKETLDRKENFDLLLMILNFSILYHCEIFANIILLP